MNVGLNNVMIFLEIVLRESKRISSVGTDFDPTEEPSQVTE